jgi:hypothetical protein
MNGRIDAQQYLLAFFHELRVERPGVHDR